MCSALCHEVSIGAELDLSAAASYFRWLRDLRRWAHERSRAGAGRAAARAERLRRAARRARRRAVRDARAAGRVAPGPGRAAARAERVRRAARRARGGGVRDAGPAAARRVRLGARRGGPPVAAPGAGGGRRARDGAGRAAAPPPSRPPRLSVLEVAPPLLRWYERERERLGVDVFDVHTHVGQHDPDTMRCSPEELLAALAQADARACVFPLQEPDGYRAANDAVIAAAQASGGRLVPFARLRPSDGRTEIEAELRRALDAGSRGVKLHPRGDSHALDDRALDGVWALAHERRLPVIVHAGRGIPALGAHAVAVCTRWPGVRLILAHAAISDLSWIGRRAQELPNLLFDTSWWAPSDLLALFATVPPGQVLFASDAPYGRVPTGALQTLRAGRQAGLSDEQLRLVLGGQLTRLLAGEELVDAGSAAGGERRIAVDVLLDRVASFLTG